MNKKMTRLGWLIVAEAAAISIGGCTLMQESEAIKMERSLTAAGFRMKLATTQKQMEQLTSLTQRKLIEKENEGKPYYIYADAEFCKCLYTGTLDAYQKYRKLARDQELMEDKIEAAGQDEAMPIHWDPLGDWYQGN